MNNTLQDILTYRREHDSTGEKQFIRDYMTEFDPVCNIKGEVIAFKYENKIEGAKTNILWTSHIDTVHHTEPDRVKQEVWIDDLTKTAFVDPKQDCLGADDGTGVWLMLQMIEHNVHGTYLFFRGEEKGCIGSGAMAEEYADYLAEFDCAIAFDRKGFDSVITHQQSSRCCSDEFGTKLSQVLSTDRDKFKLDKGGVYTDTAEFVHLIPECTNISVGYLDQHSSKETQDMDFVERLRDTLIDTQWHEIEFPIEREPKKASSWWDDSGQFGYYADHTYGVYEDYIFATVDEIERQLAEKSRTEIAHQIKEMAEYIDMLEQQGY